MIPGQKKVAYISKVYDFCCNGIGSKFIKDPEEYSKNLNDDWETFAGTKQH